MERESVSRPFLMSMDRGYVTKASSGQAVTSATVCFFPSADKRSLFSLHDLFVNFFLSQRRWEGKGTGSGGTLLCPPFFFRFLEFCGQPVLFSCCAGQPHFEHLPVDENPVFQVHVRRNSVLSGGGLILQFDLF